MPGSAAFEGEVLHHRYRLRLWGGFQIAANDGEDLTPKSRKAKALLAYLVLHPGEQLDRERLAHLLWARSGGQHSRASLRKALQQFQRFTTGEAPLLRIARDHVTLDPTHLAPNIPGSIDADDPAALGAALNEFLDADGVLLADLDGLSTEFDQWLATERRNVRAQTRQFFVEALRRRLALGETDFVLHHVARLSAIDPFDEQIIQLGMEADARTGNTPGVERRMRRLEADLAKELGVAPSAQTQTSYAELMGHILEKGGNRTEGGEAPARAEPEQARPEPLPARRFRWNPIFWLLAVLAAAAIVALIGWQRLGGGGAERRVVIALAGTGAASPEGQAFMNRLNSAMADQFPSVPYSVVASDAEASPADDGPALRIEIRLRSAGDAIAIDADMLDPDEDATIWHWATSAEPGQISLLAERTAAKLVDIFNCALVPLAEYDGDGPPQLLSALVHSCEARHDLSSATNLDYLEEVTRIDPGFAEGWRRLAYARASAASDPHLGAEDRGRSGDGMRGIWAVSAREALRRAEGLGGETDLTIATRALVITAPRAWRERLETLEAGLERFPASAALNLALGRELLRVGQTGEGLAAIRRASELEPLSPSIRSQYIMALLLYGSRQLAETQLAQAERLWPDSSAVADCRLHQIVLYGDPERALRLLEQSGEPARLLDGWRLFMRARDRAGGNGGEEYRAALDLLRRMLEADPTRLPRYLLLVGVLGDLDAVFEGPREPTGYEALARNSDTLFRIRLRPLRSDRRFIQLADRVGLLDYWIDSNRWPDFCGRGDLTYNCRREAELVRARRSE